MYILEEMLIDKTKKAGLKTLECAYISKPIGILLEDSNLDELIMYAKENGIKYLFYSCYFADKNVYIIDDETAKEKYQDLYESFSIHIKEHNEKVEKIDFEQPSTIDVFCMHEGRNILIQLCSDWSDGLKSAKEFLEELELQNKELLTELEGKKDKEKLLLKEELKELLLQNQEFAVCRNQNLRREFISKFLISKENRKYLPAFSNGNFQYDACNFADLVWNILKAKK